LQGPATEEERQRQAEAKEAAEDQRRGMLMALLQPAARDRRECSMRAFHPAKNMLNWR